MCSSVTYAVWHQAVSQWGAPEVPRQKLLAIPLAPIETLSPTILWRPLNVKQQAKLTGIIRTWN